MLVVLVVLYTTLKAPTLKIIKQYKYSYEQQYEYIVTYNIKYE